MIDLHMHTIYSDGSKTVEELLKMCEQRKLEYISITDHDTCKQYEDKAIKNNAIFSGKIITGTELRAIFKNRSIEILAYNINTEIINPWLEKYFSVDELIKNQQKGYDAMLKMFDKQGIVYDEKNIKKPERATEFIQKYIFKEAITHAENQKKLEEFANSYALFFRKGLTNPESIYFLEPIGKPSYKEVIDIIHKAGGKAFLAHPFEYRFENTIEFIDDLRKESDLDGIECFHPSSEEGNKKDILLDYARKNNLYISGGSDYHGIPKPDVEIGVGRGTLNIPTEIVKEWLH